MDKNQVDKASRLQCHTKSSLNSGVQMSLEASESTCLFLGSTPGSFNQEVHPSKKRKAVSQTPDDDRDKSSEHAQSSPRKRKSANLSHASAVRETW